MKFKSSISLSFNMLSSESLSSTSRDVSYAFNQHYLHDSVIQCLVKSQVMQRMIEKKVKLCNMFEKLKCVRFNELE